MIENPKEEKILYQNWQLCIKKLNDGNTIYLPPKIELSYFVLLYTIFIIEKKPFHQ
jgi:hypothetical protein